MQHGIIATPPNPHRKGGPYDDQFNLRKDGEQPSEDLSGIGLGTHLHFPGLASSGDSTPKPSEDDPDTNG